MDVFETRVDEFIGKLESEARNIKMIIETEELKSFRTAHLNRISESIDKMQQIIGVLRRLNFEDEATAMEVRNRLAVILEKAIALTSDRTY